MIRFIEDKDRCSVKEMLMGFYNSPAVSHSIPEKFIDNSLDAALSNSPYVKIIVAEIEGKLAGFSALSLTHTTEAGGLVVLIEEIFIKDEYRGKGIGNEIFAFIRREFDTTAKRYRLEVVEDNTSAIKLYEKLGFEKIDYNQMIIEN